MDTNDTVVEDEVLEDDLIIDDELNAKTEDTTDYKAEAEKYKGIAQRYKTKLEKASENKKEPLKINKDAGEIDLAHISFFNSNSETKIKEEDLPFIENAIKETGLPQKELFKKGWFLKDLKESQEARTVKEAIPSNSKRSAPSTRNTVDYWIAKGELPPADQVQLRRDVLNKRIENEKEGTKFGRTSYQE